MCVAELKDIAALTFVRWIENAQRFAGLNNIATTTLQDPVHAKTHTLWDHNITGESQIIGVGDTGLDYDSCFFRDDSQSVAFFPKTNTQHRKILSYKECVTDNGGHDHTDLLDAHGTHVSGSAVGNSIGGDSQYNGLAPGAKLFFHDLTCGSDPAGLYLPGDLYDYYLPQYETGARVGSNSWGSSSPSTYTAVDRETDRFLFEQPDFLAVFAAGNNAFAGILSPSAAKNVLTVGAHTNSLDASARGNIATFSAHGPTYDGRIKPELTAPGSPVHSASSDGKLDSNQCTVSAKSGTSMATPFVAAGAALLREFLQAGYFPSGVKNASAAITPSGALMKALLIHSTAPMVSVTPSATPNGVEGFGRLELDDTLFRFADTPNIATKPILNFFDNVTLAQDESFARCYSYTTLIDLKATIVWMDPPSAAEGAHMSITNDLDLTIADSSGVLHFPDGNPTFTRGQNVEQAKISSAQLPGSKKYASVNVYGLNVETTNSGGGQAFSIAVSGTGLQLEDAGKCDGNKCPNNCSGHGTCENGQCHCAHGYHLVDCSECDALTVCNGNGVCDAATLQCVCGAHVASSSKECNVCASGYFGPHCDSTCNCGAHGKCNNESGVCVCDASDKQGYWSGSTCNECAEDHMDTSSGCRKKAFWCEHRRVRNIISSTNGTILINDWGSYANSQQCAWQIIAAHPSWQVRLTVEEMNIEDPYDTLSIYSGANSSGTRIRKLTGRSTGTFTSSGPSMFLKFDADYVGSAQGFTAAFEVVRSCTDDMCNGHGKCNSQNLCVCSGNYNATTFCGTCLGGWIGANCTSHPTESPLPTDVTFPSDITINSDFTFPSVITIPSNLPSDATIPSDVTIPTGDDPSDATIPSDATLPTDVTISPVPSGSPLPNGLVVTFTTPQSWFHARAILRELICEGHREDIGHVLWGPERCPGFYDGLDIYSDSHTTDTSSVFAVGLNTTGLLIQAMSLPRVAMSAYGVESVVDTEISFPPISERGSNMVLIKTRFTEAGVGHKNSWQPFVDVRHTAMSELFSPPNVSDMTLANATCAYDGHYNCSWVAAFGSVDAQVEIAGIDWASLGVHDIAPSSIVAAELFPRGIDLDTSTTMHLSNRVEFAFLYSWARSYLTFTSFRSKLVRTFDWNAETTPKDVIPNSGDVHLVKSSAVAFKNGSVFESFTVSFATAVQQKKITQLFQANKMSGFSTASTNFSAVKIVASPAAATKKHQQNGSSGSASKVPIYAGIGGGVVLLCVVIFIISKTRSKARRVHHEAESNTHEYADSFNMQQAGPHHQI